MREMVLAAALMCAGAFAMPALAQEAQRLDVNPKIVAVAQKDARDLLVPTSTLSSYQVIEIAPMAFSDPVKADPRKLAKAQEFEARFGLHLRDTVKSWNAKAGEAEALSVKKLIIKPGVQSLQIVSGGARFFAGALSGDSKVTVTMQFVDAASGAVLASPTISKSSGGFAGAWTFGSTDNNLLSYVAETANQYVILHLMDGQSDAAPVAEPALAPSPPAQ